MYLLLLVLLWGCAPQDQEPTPPPPVVHTRAMWDRNAEQDQVTHYRIYLCEGRGCTLEQTEAYVRDEVPQSPLGESLEWRLPPHLTGSIAVSAVNVAGESPLSASVEFTS